MHARFVTFADADPDKREHAIETIRGTALPLLRQYDGFAGYLAMWDESNRRAKVVLLFESQEAAEQAEKELVERRKQFASDVGWTVESAELYEALVVELEGARV
jgi:hypothetical protein